MRHVLALLAIVLLAALPAPAAAQSFVEAAPVVSAPAAPTPVTDAVATAPAQQEKVQESARAESLARDVRDDRQFAQRGSFWWLVGVIVIAGVLLAVLLD
jgi:beta-lactamase regulating signal transducer with metallopeptidase domain